MADPGQDSTPYVDALLAYAERDPGRFQVPGHKGGSGADPAMRELVGDTGLRNDVPSITEGVDIGPEPTPFQQSQILAAEAWGARRTWFLVNGASQGNHAICLALAHIGAEVVVQRNVHSSVIDGLVMSGLRPALRRPRTRPRAGDRPLPDPGRARRGARRHPGRGRRDGRLADLLRRLRRPRRPRRGRPRARRAAGRRRGLGRPPPLPPRPPARRPQLRRRPRHLLDPQDRRQPDPGGDAPPRRRRAARRGRRRPLRQPGRVDQPERAALRLARRGPPARRGPRRASCSTRPWPRSPGRGRRSRRSRASPSSTRSWSGAPSVAGWDPLRLAIDVRGTGASGYRLAKTAFEQRGDRPRARLRERRRRDLRPRRAGGRRRRAPGRARWPRWSGQLETEGTTPQEPAGAAAALGRAGDDAARGLPRPQEVVPFDEAAGRIAAESLAAYPPGIPNVLPGERLTRETLDYIAESVGHGGHVRGSSDRELRTLRVAR